MCKLAARSAPPARAAVRPATLGLQRNSLPRRSNSSQLTTAISNQDADKVRVQPYYNQLATTSGEFEARGVVMTAGVLALSCLELALSNPGVQINKDLKKPLLDLVATDTAVLGVAISEYIRYYSLLDFYKQKGRSTIKNFLEVLKMDGFEPK